MKPRIDPLVPFDDWHLRQAQALLQFDDPEPERGWLINRRLRPILTFASWLMIVVMCGQRKTKCAFSAQLLALGR